MEASLANDAEKGGNMNCKTCRHYHFYQMITNGSYGYSGTGAAPDTASIPCKTCSRFSLTQDNFEPMLDPVSQQAACLSKWYENKSKTQGEKGK